VQAALLQHVYASATKFKSTNEGALISVSHDVKFELFYIFPLLKSILCTKQLSFRSSSTDKATCYRDVSQRFVASCVLAFIPLGETTSISNLFMRESLRATLLVASRENQEYSAVCMHESACVSPSGRTAHLLYVYM